MLTDDDQRLQVDQAWLAEFLAKINGLPSRPNKTDALKQAQDFRG